MNTTKFIQDTLVDGDPLDASLADLVPQANRIIDASATFISKADKKLAGDDGPVGLPAQALGDAIDLARKAADTGAAISQLLRKPTASRERLKEARRNETAATRENAA